MSVQSGCHVGALVPTIALLVNIGTVRSGHSPCGWVWCMCSFDSGMVALCLQQCSFLRTVVSPLWVGCGVLIQCWVWSESLQLFFQLSSY